MAVDRESWSNLLNKTGGKTVLQKFLSENFSRLKEPSAAFRYGKKLQE
jgi:hypothetical protein